jgi:hypothetical protein
MIVINHLFIPSMARHGSCSSCISHAITFSHEMWNSSTEEIQSRYNVKIWRFRVNRWCRG